MKAKKLLEALRKIAPSVALSVEWSHDPDSTWGDISERMDGENPEDWQPWNSEVKASAIVDGVEISESSHLGGTWEKACDHPSQSNPDISGYLPQMLQEALLALGKRCQQTKLLREIQSACDFLNAEMKADYENSAANSRQPSLPLKAKCNLSPSIPGPLFLARCKVSKLGVGREF